MNHFIAVDKLQCNVHMHEELYNLVNLTKVIFN